jgi:hypothetical protein
VTVTVLTGLGEHAGLRCQAVGTVHDRDERLHRSFAFCHQYTPDCQDRTGSSASSRLLCTRVPVGTLGGAFGDNQLKSAGSSRDEFPRSISTSAYGQRDYLPPSTRLCRVERQSGTQARPDGEKTIC